MMELMYDMELMYGAYYDWQSYPCLNITKRLFPNNPMKFHRMATTTC